MKFFDKNIWGELANIAPVIRQKLPIYIQLTRIDRPIGIYLLFWPTITALWIASEGLPSLSLLIVFSLGTAVMRSAGCCINDFADCKIDGKVQRTQDRPLVLKKLSKREALTCFAILSSIGFCLLLLTNMETIQLAFFAMWIIVIYPFMKRHTNLPQIILGIAFSWGILMAFTATLKNVPPEAYLLFIANVLWTVAYDTQYAMVDREYDLRVGVKSTAILFGYADRLMIGILQTSFILTLLLLATHLQFSAIFYVSVGIASLLLLYQQFLIKDRLPNACFKAFINNSWVGAVIFLGTVSNYL